jgi:peptidyl-tRNA hydrolase, PTH2 family
MSDIRPLPSPTAMLIATAILAGISGYMIGIASSLGFLPIPFQTKVAPVGKPRGRTDGYDDEEESSEEDIDASILDHAPNWANGLEADKRDGLRATMALKKAAGAKKEVEVKSESSSPAWENASGEYKLILVVRTDLGMTKGMCSSSALMFNHF